jgi:hypothetical protein
VPTSPAALRVEGCPQCYPAVLRRPYHPELNTISPQTGIFLTDPPPGTSAFRPLHGGLHGCGVLKPVRGRDGAGRHVLVEEAEPRRSGRACRALEGWRTPRGAGSRPCRKEVKRHALALQPGSDVEVDDRRSHSQRVLMPRHRARPRPGLPVCLVALRRRHPRTARKKPPQPPSISPSP